MNSCRNISILGASSLIAPWLLKRLTRDNMAGFYYSRNRIHFETGGDFNWQKIDSNQPGNFQPPSQSTVISLLPLWLLPPLLPQLKNCQQLIAFSTTSIFSKHNSPNLSERKLIQQILEAEEQLTRHCNLAKIPWTILRPTMIYDGRTDANITAIANFIKRWHILPLANPANGLRQPVHADDLAAAAVAAINNSASFEHAFNLGGGETLSYREMVLRIFQTLEKPARTIRIPSKVVTFLSKYSKQGSAIQDKAAIFTRMNQDLICDWSEARDKLGYSPRLFQP